MPAGRRQPQYQQIAPQEAYLGDYSALAEQFLRKKDKPIYSVGQGLVEAGSDIAEAFLMKDAAERDKRKDEVTNEALAKAFENTSNTNLGIYPEFAGQSPAMSANQRGRYASSRLAEADPNAAAAMTPSLMQMAQQFEPPKPTYMNVEGVGLAKVPGDGSEPSVVLKRPEPARAPQRYEVGGNLVDEAGKVIFSAPKAAPQKGIGEIYKDKIGGTIEPGMQPEVGPNGQPTGRQVPIAGGSKDPAVMEAERVKKLEEEKPQAAQMMEGGSQIIDQMLAQITRIKNNPNTPDVVGGIEGRGWYPNTLGDGNSTAWSNVNNLRGAAQVRGLQTMRDQSKTGGAVGSVTEPEWPKLESMLANLDPTQGEKDYFDQLDSLEKSLLATKNLMRSTFQQTYGSKPAVVVDGPSQAGAGASGSWGSGQTRVIAGARVTKVGN